MMPRMEPRELAFLALDGIRGQIERLTTAFEEVVKVLGPPAQPRPAKKRPHMSAKQRKAASRRMKAYWKARAEAKKGKKPRKNAVSTP